MSHPIILDDDGPTVRRVRRELASFEALAHRRRMRAWIARCVRGLAGAGGSFALLVKLKVAGSIGGKLVLADLIGLGLALPLVTLGLLAVLILVLAVVTCEPIGGCDCPGDCCERNARRDRLKALIDARTRWLARRDGPAPRITPDEERLGRGRRR